jgi:hypothetical protein
VAASQQEQLSVARVFDLGFVLAVGALGWGLSLASYRLLAERCGWPLGRWQAERHALTFAIGLACIGLGVHAAFLRLLAGDAWAGILMVLFGIAWAVFWTGFLHAGAQSALLLAPAAALILLTRVHG